MDIQVLVFPRRGAENTVVAEKWCMHSGVAMHICNLLPIRVLKMDRCPVVLALFFCALMKLY